MSTYDEKVAQILLCFLRGRSGADVGLHWELAMSIHEVNARSGAAAQAAQGAASGNDDGIPHTVMY